MIDEVVEELVRRVLREELSGLSPCAGRDGRSRAREEPQVFTVPEVAAALRLSRSRAYDLVREGRIRSVRVGRRLLVPRWAVQELLDGKVHDPAGTCSYCGAMATARYVSRAEDRSIAPIDLCGSTRCHEALLDALKSAGALN